MRLILLGIANHAVLSGSRVTVSLAALDKGATPLTVGVLMALYALLPMVLAVSAGRFSDRVGVRQPMLFGTTAIAVGAALPIAFPGLPILFASAAILGTGFMIFQVAAQNVTGELGGPAERARNFSLLALGYSTSGFIGPLVAGLAIDHLGFGSTFAVLAAVPFIPLVVLARGGLALPGPHRHDGPVHHGGVRALLRHRTLRRLFAINALFAAGWDLFTVFVPVYGARIGLSASEIGLVLSTFAAATFVVRFLMPRIARSYSEQQVLTIALFVAGRGLPAVPARAERADAARAVVLSRSRAGERPADGDGAPAHARADGADGRGGRRAHVARQHDVGRRSARLRRARHHRRPGAGVLLGRRVPHHRRHVPRPGSRARLGAVSRRASSAAPRTSWTLEVRRFDFRFVMLAASSLRRMRRIGGMR